MHLQDALGLIAFELVSVQPFLAAGLPTPTNIVDAGFTPLGIGTGHLGDFGKGSSRASCLAFIFGARERDSFGELRGSLCTFETLASQKVSVREGLTQHKVPKVTKPCVPTMSSQMAMNLACQYLFFSKETVTTSPFQSILIHRSLDFSL